MKKTIAQILPAASTLLNINHIHTFEFDNNEILDEATQTKY